MSGLVGWEDVCQVAICSEISY